MLNDFGRPSVVLPQRGNISYCVSTLYLPHLLDLGASFPDQGAALAGRHHESQGDRGLTGGRTVAHGVDDVLENRWREAQVKDQIKSASEVLEESGQVGLVFGVRDRVLVVVEVGVGTKVMGQAAVWRLTLPPS